MDSKISSDQPPVKKIKSGQEIGQLIDECFRLQFNTNKTDEEKECLELGVKTIIGTLKQARSSSDVSLGPTRLEAKRSWGKCLGVMLENSPESLNALKFLKDKLSTGAGLFI